MFTGPFNTFAGVQIFEDANLVKWVRRPRLPASKCKRIRSKWRKKYPQGHNVPSEVVYQMPFGFVMHPVMAAKLRAELSTPQE